MLSKKHTLKIFLLIVSLVFTITQLSAQKKITGQFDASEVLNEFLSLDSTEKVNYVQFLNSLDTLLIEEYFGLLRELKFEEADSLIQQDEKLKNVPVRAIALLYTFYHINKHNLLEQYPLTTIDESGEWNLVVYMNEKKFVKYSKKLEQELTLNVELIAEIPLTETKIFKLKK